MGLDLDQSFDAIAVGKAADFARAMLRDAGDQVGGYTDVDRSIAPAGKVWA